MLKLLKGPLKLCTPMALNQPFFMLKKCAIKKEIKLNVNLTSIPGSPRIVSGLTSASVAISDLALVRKPAKSGNMLLKKLTLDGVGVGFENSITPPEVNATIHDRMLADSPFKYKGGDLTRR